MVRKEDLPNNSVFGKVLSEIWALKVLLKQPKWPARPIKNLLPHLKFKTKMNKNYIFLKEIHQGFQICTQNLVPSNF